MPKYIAKLAKDAYVDWSEIVDAPVSYVETREDAIRLWGLDRIERADKNGHSMIDADPMTPEEIIRCNRAGPNEGSLHLKTILNTYKRGYVNETN